MTFELQEGAIASLIPPAPATTAMNHAAQSSLAVSIVVPGLNEAESLPELESRLRKVLDGVLDYEIIFIDDGSTDSTWSVIKKLRVDNPRVHGIRLRRNFGKAMALSAAFERVRGEFVVTMDADLQDNPEDLPSFIKKLEEGSDVVVGWKVKRLDPTNRLILTRIFNYIVGVTTGMRLHDMNCGFKAYRQEVIRSIPIYGDLFRFIPVLAMWQGFHVVEIPIKHDPRKYGRSRYGLERILRGLFDLMSVVFLTRYARRPMHLFGLIGLLLAIFGTIVLLYLSGLWLLGHSIGGRPLFMLGILLVILGMQFFSIGLLGEFMTFQYQQRHTRKESPVREATNDLRQLL